MSNQQLPLSVSATDRIPRLEGVFASSPPLHAQIITADGISTNAELIAPLPVVMLDERLHTDKHPFCTDESCLCHANQEFFLEYIETPYQEGLLSSREALRLFYSWLL